MNEKEGTGERSGGQRRAEEPVWGLPKLWNLHLQIGSERKEEVERRSRRHFMTFNLKAGNPKYRIETEVHGTNLTITPGTHQTSDAELVIVEHVVGISHHLVHLQEDWADSPSGETGCGAGFALDRLPDCPNCSLYAFSPRSLQLWLQLSNTNR